LSRGHDIKVTNVPLYKGSAAFEAAVEFPHVRGSYCLAIPPGPSAAYLYGIYSRKEVIAYSTPLRIRNFNVVHPFVHAAWPAEAVIHIIITGLGREVFFTAHAFIL
jgi:hypothetical protein